MLTLQRLKFPRFYRGHMNASAAEVYGLSGNDLPIALQEILGKYSVSDADLEKVIQWKHASA